ncbi:MAG: MauE/DoxX family redox-associated membrane protein [Pseudomonadales bacterium]
MLSTLYIGGCWLLAGVFAGALAHKLRHRLRYRAALAAYRLVPKPAVAFIATLLTALELTIVALLLLLQPLGTLLAAVVLSLYAGAIAINLLRGHRQIDCGCGDEPTPLSGWLLLRNGVLIVLALWLSWPGAGLVQGFALALPNILLALAFCGVSLGIYASVNQLLANRGRYERLWLAADADSSVAITGFRE